jgi:putative peptidoglycan lipid II flippase
MSTPPSEPDPYPGSGGSEQDVRDWTVRPAVPGWSAGQQFYTGPVFDDTGWHIDLSGVDWGDEPEADDEPPRQRDRSGRRRTTLRFRNHGPPGNGYAPPPTPAVDPADITQRYAPPPADGRQPGYADFDGSADAPATRRRRPDPGGRGPDGQPTRSDRPSGRHARLPQSDEQWPSGPATTLRRPGPPPGTTRPRPGTPSPLPGGLPPLPPEQLRPGGRRPGRGSGPAQVMPGAGGRRPGAPGPAATGAPRQAAPFNGPPRPGVVVPRPLLPGAPQPDAGAEYIARASRVMAVGTFGSRITGFLRTIAQSYALGALGIAAAYNLSNTLPNAVYNLALGGILTSVIVPLIVNAAKRDGGRRDYDQRMFTLITVALAGITLVAEVAAVPIVHLYAGSKIAHSHTTLHLAVIFALFFIPQIFFYGFSSLIGAILNSRGSFAAPMWTPIVNNMVVIGVLGLYVAMAGLGKSPATISGHEVALLGLGTTLGVAAQTAALVPALRRVGFRWQPRIDFRRSEVAEIGRMAGWMFGYIATTQVALFVTTKVAGDATLSGVTDYNYAWLLFQLPYAVVGISVITALLPRMSAHAAERRYRLVRQDFSTGVRLAATIVVPCSLVLAVLGPSLAELFLGHGHTTPAQARYMGLVFAVFCLGLLPYMLFQLQLRVFYSLHDSKTPAIIGVVTMVVNIVANVVALDSLPAGRVVAGLGVGFGLANLVGAVIAWSILSRRLHGLDGYLIGRSLVRMHAAAIPAALLAIVVVILSGNAAVDVIIGGGLAIAMYFVFARALRIDELTGLTRTVMGRLGR